MKILRLVLFNLILFCLVFLCGCDKKNNAEVPDLNEGNNIGEKNIIDDLDEQVNLSEQDEIPALNEGDEIRDKNLIRQSDEQVNFNGKDTNISILEYESHEREIKVGDLSITIPAKFVDFIYSKTLAEDIDNDNEQELLISFFSLGSAASQGLIILKIKDNDIYEIPLPKYIENYDSLGLKAEVSFTEDYEVVVDVVDCSKILKMKLDENLKELLYTNGKLNDNISKDVDPASVIEVAKDSEGKNVIKIYQKVWAPVHVERICDLVTTIKIDDNKSEIVDIYLLK